MLMPRFLRFVCLIGVLSAVCTAGAHAQVTVCASGCDYTSIDDAVDAAAMGSTTTIQLSAENYVIGTIEPEYKNIRLVGTTDDCGNPTSIVTTGSFVLEDYGFYGTSFTNIEFRDCNNKTVRGSIKGGGAVFCNFANPSFANCTFRNCRTGANGGAVLMYGGSVTFTDCRFIGCHAGSSGGALDTQYWSPTTLTVDNCVFIENTGTAISHGNGWLDVTDSDFTRNHGSNGGAIGLSNQGYLSMDNCRLWDNSAGGWGGGALYYEYTSNLNISNTAVWCNTHNGGGYNNVRSSVNGYAGGWVNISGSGNCLRANSDSTDCGSQCESVVGEDSDGDGVYDFFDSFPDDDSETEDSDCDGIGDNSDPCPDDVSNPTVDTDLDGTLDCVDNCPDDSGKVEPGECGCGVADTDTDQDGTPDCNDDLPEDPNESVDSDGDGTGDNSDLCPNDPDKIAPGICGCGVAEADTDSDLDGTPDCIDGCPNDANKIAAGVCGCGNADTDTDGDGTPDCVDNCPNDADKVGPGQCGCGTADTDTDQDGTPDCNDDLPEDPNESVDSDGDGTGDNSDLCPNDPDKTEAGVCGCGFTEDTDDDDGDGFANCLDTFPDDPTEHSDTDGDGVGDNADVCPNDPNKTGEAGTCGCGFDETIDSDQDGTPDCQDTEALVTVGESIQVAIDNASDGEVIQLQYGTHALGRELLLNTKSVTLRGAVAADGTRLTVLDGAGTHRILFVDTAGSSESVFEDLIFRNGYADGSDDSGGTHAGAVRIRSTSPAFTNCLFDDNEAVGSGGGVHVHSGSPTFVDCDFTNNTANQGGGGWVGDSTSEPSFIDCQFTGNTSHDRGGGFYGHRGIILIERCTFDGNTVTGGNGGGLTAYLTELQIVDCTITNNEASGTGGGIDSNGNFQRVYLQGTLICGNVPDAVDNGYNDNGGNCVSDGPCTDSDEDGTLDCFDGCPNDADKVEPGDCGCGVVDTDTDGDGVSDCIDAFPTDDSETADTDGDGVGDNADVCPEDPDKADDTGICGCGFDDTIDSDQDGTVDCQDSETLVRIGESIQDAIDAATSGDVIQLQYGTHALGRELLLNTKSVTLRGAVAADGTRLTVLDGAGTHRILFVDTAGSSESVFEDLIFRNGYADGSDDSGGTHAGAVRIRLSSPAFTNCLFDGNEATGSGGAVHLAGSSSTFVDCDFTNNTANQGGGGWVGDAISQPRFTDCQFTGNVANTRAGGFYGHRGVIVLERCRFEDNAVTAGNGGGLSTFLSELQIFDCVITNNEASGTGGGINGGSQRVILQGSVICGNEPDAVDNGYTDQGGNCVIDDLCTDSDEDGTLDCFDGCPNDADKVEPGDCGCGVAEIDTDQDGTPDCIDDCPNDANKIAAGVCGCNVADTDTDLDGIADCNDSETVVTIGDSISEAIAAATDGDVLLLAAGTHQLSESITILATDPQVTLRGVLDADGTLQTILDGGQSIRVLDIETASELAYAFEDLVIQNGAGGSGGGGGALVQGDGTVSFSNCRILSNTASTRGAGVYALGGNLQFSDCLFESNSSNDGAGIYLSSADAQLTTCVFNANSGKVGVGIFVLQSTTSVIDSEFTNNSLTSDLYGWGTALNNNGGNVQFSGCLVEANEQSQFGSGSVVRTINSGTTSLENTNVICNWIDDGFVDNGGNCIVEDCDYADVDEDGVLDGCDGCPNDPDKIAPGICGCGVAEADTDSDLDGTPDCIDGCPNDANKIAAGACGCGSADTDTDEDGTLDCFDNCPNDADKLEPGDCGCGTADTDGDSDGTPDCNDDCPNDPNKIAPGTCGCGVAETDTDDDGTLDCNDDCPNDPNKVVPGTCGCGVADTDTDEDGTPDCNDACANDPNKVVAGTCGCGVADTDTDADGIADCIDACPYDDDNDADADGICGDVDNCALSNADQADCNGNGIGDTCEVADGLLPDCDGNGVPDGCDLQDAGADCNGNGILDACEIANGFAEDCDDDGVIDSCQIAGDGSLDCDGNGRLDSCDLDDGAADCNANNVLDSCDIANGGSFDDDGNGIPDECLADAVYNQTDGSYWDALDTAMDGALEGDTLLVPESFFGALDGLELTLGGLTLQSLGGVTLDSMPDGILLGGDTTLAAAADSAIAIGSALDLLDGEASTLSGASVSFGETAAVSIPAGSMLAVESSQALVNDGAITLLDGLLIAQSGTAQSATGSLTGFGTLSGAMTNAGTVTVQADLQCTDDFTNDGEVRIQSGTLTTVGTFTNNGTVLGSLGEGRSGSGGAPSMTVIGDLVLGSEGSLLFGGSGTSLRVSGDLSIAATQSVQIDLSSTDVRMIGLGDEVGAVQRLELLGEDLGATEDGFDRTLGGFPIGTLRVGPMPTTVRLVDDHDNDGLGTDACEVLYVDTLQLDANTTLETNGCLIYCRELVLSGSASIDVPSNVVVISDPPNCPGDVTGDETVDGQDLAAVLAAWGQDVPDVDQNADGTIDGQDLAAVLAAWGLPCGQ